VPPEAKDIARGPLVVQAASIIATASAATPRTPAKHGRLNDVAQASAPDPLRIDTPAAGFVPLLLHLAARSFLAAPPAVGNFVAAFRRAVKRAARFYFVNAIALTCRP
jgi:hypothetical protein